MNDLSPLASVAARSLGSVISLIEPSFEDAAVAIAGDPDLSDDLRRHWPCSLRRIAAVLDRPMVLIPARWSAVRIQISQLKAVRLGITQKTLSNHASNVRAALAWMHKEKQTPARGAPLTPEWRALYDECPSSPQRTRLASLMRYCSGRDISPDCVDEAVIDAFFAYRLRTTSLSADAAARRVLAHHWNDRARTIAGWPSHFLVEPPSRQCEAFPPWADYPIGLRDDIEAYLTSLTRVRKTAKGRRLRPAKATTIRGRRAMLEAAMRTATRIGVGMEQLTSLASLLHPDVSRRILDAYWEKSGERPSIFTIDLARLFVSLARSAQHLSAAEFEALDDMRSELEHHSPAAMTDKNLAAIRTFMQSDAWRALHHLPRLLMDQAKEASYSSPVKAAVRAQMAAAIGILNVAPIRRANLGQIRIGENLIRSGGPKAPYRLVFPGYDVKNRVNLDFPLDAELTALIDDYLFNYRPALVDQADGSWLFPGERDDHKCLATLSGQITACIEKSIGLRLTVHQFRHLSAAIILKHQPGNYELVRLLLGHRTVQVTIRNYIGLETTHASEVYGDLVRNLRARRAEEEDDA
ncbi:MAG: tyrosine-type recombinase/integrase [Methylocella sp.]